MSERRYVVEIARAVSDDRIESAADYVALRLGMDRQRIRTLLAGRTGPVTRPVLAEKADSIAEVFTAAGVTVMIMEAPDQLPVASVSIVSQPHTEHPYETGLPHERDDPERDGAPDRAAPADAEHLAADDLMGSTDYEADYGDDLSQDTEPPVTDWNVDSAWEAEDDDLPWHRQPASPPAVSPAEPVVSAGDAPTSGVVRDLTDPQLPSTRWVPSPFDEHVDGPAARTDADSDVSWVSGLGGRGANGSGVASDDLHDLESSTSRPWVTPGRSQFGDMALPTERAPLRAYLLWALVVSVIVLIALQLLFAVRERGVGDASFESGLQAYRSGDFVTARRQWESVAKTGSAEAQYMLGHLVQNGLGQPWSNAAAAGWYRQAADQGLPEAQVALADLYIRGVGVEPDLRTGASWLERAAGAGYGPALYQYAELLLHGRGVPQDFDAALDLFARAAAGGSPEAADYVALAEHVRREGQVGAVQP